MDRPGSQSPAPPEPLPTSCSTHNSKHYWERPQEYDPERWLIPGVNAEHALCNDGTAAPAKGKTGGQGRVQVAAAAGTGASAALGDDGGRALRFMPFGLVSCDTNVCPIKSRPRHQQPIFDLTSFMWHRVLATASARTRAR